MRILSVIGCVGSVIASLFGGWDAALVTLLIFMGVDYVTGLIVAGVFHTSEKTENGALESRAGWKGLSNAPFSVFSLVWKDRERGVGKPCRVERSLPERCYLAGGSGGLPP